jgi:hypothetical protein
MSGSLNQLRRAELTATCRLAVSRDLWQSPHVAPIRCSARISDLSPGNFVAREASRADPYAPEKAATAFNAHRLSWVPAASSNSSLPHRRGPDQFALLDAFVRRAAEPKTLSIIIYLRAAPIQSLLSLRQI